MPRTLKLGLFALVLVGLVGGSWAYVAARKAVTLTVDGAARHVDTYADTVAEVLQDEGLQVAAHDVVLPTPGAHLTDGDSVVLNRARPLQLTVDGVPSEVYVTAQSVDEALQQLGYRGSDLVLSASRSDRLPLAGMALSITTPKQVTLVVDGGQRVLSTTVGTVAAFLAEQGVTLSPTDRSSVDPGQPLTDGMRVQVQRVQVSQATEDAPLPHGSTEVEDPDAYVGTRTVTQEGEDGVQTTTFRVTVTDGVETGREKVGVAVTKPPVDEQVSVGSKPKPAPAKRSDDADSAPSSADGLNWSALAKCESGGNPRAVSATGKYRGLYQFSTSTWSSVGGSGDPIQASATEQTSRAKMLYARSGASQWGCGSHLFD